MTEGEKYLDILLELFNYLKHILICIIVLTTFPHLLHKDSPMIGSSRNETAREVLLWVRI